MLNFDESRKIKKISQVGSLPAARQAASPSLRRSRRRLCKFFSLRVPLVLELVQVLCKLSSSLLPRSSLAPSTGGSAVLLA